MENSEYPNTRELLMLISQDNSYIKKDIQEIKDSLSKHYVSNAEFAPVRNIAYGLVTVILLGVLTEVLNLLLKS